MSRRHGFMLAALLAMCGTPVPAHAVALLTTAELNYGSLTVTAAGGWNNSISVIRNTVYDFTVIDTAGILPGNGCVPLAPPVSVECVGTYEIEYVSVDAGDQDDTVSVDGSASVGSLPYYYQLSYYVFGGDGNDSISGYAGYDTYFSFDGGNGNDQLVGSTAGDSLDGDGGDDYVSGGDGNDYVNGGPGYDTVYGDAGNDDVMGDWYWSAGDADRVDGGTGNDDVSGYDGNDTIIGGPGEDNLYGDDGDDTFYATDGWIDSMYCGAGYDDTYIDYTLDWRYTDCES